MEVIDPQNQDSQSLKDEHLMNLARKRVGFKSHLASYVIINAFLCALWYVTDKGGYFWPIWPMMGWGIGVAFNYVAAYHNDTFFSVEKEYEKLKKNKQGI